MISPGEREGLSSTLGDTLIFTLGDLKSIPLAELHLVTGPAVRSEMLRGLRGAAHAYHWRSDQSVNIRPSSGDCPFLFASPVAAGLQGDAA